jgi:hypothetical protein
VKTIPGSYPWSNSVGVPGTGLMEIGEISVLKDAKFIPLIEGLDVAPYGHYEVELPDGKKVYARAK